MSRELEALKRILNYWVIFDEEKDDCRQIKDILPKSSQIVETALKTNKKKLDIIGEILVDISKGNYADLNVAINEIREELL